MSNHKQTENVLALSHPFRPATYLKGWSPLYSRGFTLVELLTVLAIIGILATLLMSALSTARKKSHMTSSISNLRQIALGFTMYRDDHTRRPRTWDVLLEHGYLGHPGILKCLADKSGTWGNRVQSDLTGIVSTNDHSYLYPLPWDDWAWNRIEKSGPHAGLAACQLHGIGRPDPELPSMRDYEGLVLRAQMDGAVVRREIFWSNTFEMDSMEMTPPADLGFGPPEVGAPPETSQAPENRNQFDPQFPWAFFMDEPLQQP